MPMTKRQNLKNNLKKWRTARRKLMIRKFCDSQTPEKKVQETEGDNCCDEEKTMEEKNTTKVRLPPTQSLF